MRVHNAEAMASVPNAVELARMYTSMSLSRSVKSVLGQAFARPAMELEAPLCANQKFLIQA
jgi:hypothetical protein